MGSARDPRLDAVKATALTFVLVWHLHPVYVDRAPAIEWLVSFFDFEVSLVAVPSFLVVSLLLFLPRATEGPMALARRLSRLGQVFLFWSGVQLLLYALVHRALPPLSFELLAQGGPALPRIGGSVFYYLFDLMVVTAAAAAFARIPEPWRRRTAVLVAAASAAWFEYALFTHRTLLYHRADNFLVYVPIAFYLPALVPHYRLFLLGWALFAAQDVLVGRAADCVYGRVSIACGAVALLGWFHARAPRPPGRVVQALATWSLGIYALHKYALYLLLVAKGSRSLNLTVGGATVHVAALLLFAGTLLLTALGIALLARTPLRRFVA